MIYKPNIKNAYFYKKNYNPYNKYKIHILIEELKIMLLLVVAVIFSSSHCDTKCDSYCSHFVSSGLDFIFIC